MAFPNHTEKVIRLVRVNVSEGQSYLIEIASEEMMGLLAAACS